MLEDMVQAHNLVPITEFLSKLKDEKQDVLSLLNLDQKDFVELPQEELLNIPEEIALGVTRIQMKFDTLFFGVFDSLLIKHLDNKDMKYVFVGTTTDVPKITEIVETFFQEYKIGFYDNRKYSSFLQKEKIASLAAGKFSSAKDDLGHVWVYKTDFSFLLQYKTSPLNQLVMNLTMRYRAVDRSVRRKGTILDLLKLNVHQLLMSNEVDSQATHDDEGALICMDYYFRLEHREFDVFDVVRVRIFDGERSFRREVQTHLTLTASTEIPQHKIMAIVEQLMDMYGADDLGTQELSVNDLTQIEEGLWFGRQWNFNHIHGLWDLQNKEEKMAYGVNAHIVNAKRAFNLDILFYNQLVDYFGV